MNRAFWGIFVIMLGVTGILFITFFQTVTNTDEHNSHLLKEVVEAAMWDAVDDSYYRQFGTITINKEKFTESFIRRFAENSNLSNTYKIDIMDINENPPKVRVRVTSSIKGQVTANLGSDEINNFTITNKVDAILETPY